MEPREQVREAVRPTESIVESPIAEPSSDHPQSQNPNMFLESIPNDSPPPVGRDRDEVLRDRGLVAPEALGDHSRAVCALVMVSRVVKVLLEMMNSVSSGERSRVFS